MAHLTLDIDPRTHAQFLCVDVQEQEEIERLAQAAIRRELFRMARKRAAARKVATGNSHLRAYEEDFPEPATG